MQAVNQSQLSFQVLKQTAGETDWINGLTVIYVMRGPCVIRHDKETIRFPGEGIHVVNPLELFRVSCDGDAQAIVCSIPRRYLRLAEFRDAEERIRCSAEPGGVPEYDRLRAQFALLFRDYFRDEVRQSAQMTKDVLELIGMLMQTFREPAGRLRQESTVIRAKRILDFLEEHYAEDISLGDAAEAEYLTPSYLARFLRKHLDATFIELLSDIRIRHAVAMLEQGGASVTQISYDCGFKNVHAFIGRFSAQYGQTPGAWRKSHAAQREQALAGGADSSGIAGGAEDGMAGAGEFDALLQYVPASAAQDVQQAAEIENRTIHVALGGRRGKRLPGAWKRMINIGYAREGLNATIQEQLRLAQREIGFEFIRFHGIFDEDMHVYSEQPDGRPQYNFAYVDMLFDFLLSIGLKPYVEFSYIPPALAARHELIFSRRSFITTASDPARWEALIRETVLHWIGRYGFEAVRGWRFTSVGINCTAFGLASLDELCALYRSSYRAVKGIDSALLFGGPGGYSNMTEDGPEADRFLQYARENGCVPDFFTMKCYPYGNAEHDGRFVTSFVSRLQTPAMVSGDLNYTHNALTAAEGLLNRHRLNNLPIWMEEWNSTIWQRDIANDTCYRAAWLAHSFCQNYNRTEAFGYWLLSDFMEEGVLPEECYHGGFGLLTGSGIPKPSWNVLLFLRELGGRVYAAGEDYLVSRDEEHVAVLLTNYCHYDNLFRLRYQSIRRNEEAYQSFVKKSTRRIRIELEGAPEQSCRVRKYSVSRADGSSFDEFVRMGASGSPRPEEILYLTEKARPSYRTEWLTAGGKPERGLIWTTDLAPHETQLIIFELSGRKD